MRALSGRRAVLLVSVATLALAGVAGCGGSSTSGESPATSATASSEGMSVQDAWIKATDESMTGAFGVLSNPSGADITVTGASSPVAGMVELHETVMTDGAMVMREVDGGLVIPAGGELVLEPGGNHIMLMDLQASIAPGQEVPVTITTSTGESMTFTAVAKEFAGANESYQPSAMASPTES